LFVFVTFIKSRRVYLQYYLVGVVLSSLRLVCFAWVLGDAKENGEGKGQSLDTRLHLRARRRFGCSCVLSTQRC
jgi:hypothetical protein